MSTKIDLSPNNLLAAYCQGIFPMGDSSGNVNWYEADPRGIVPLDQLHIPHDLKRILRQKKFTTTLNRCFLRTIKACADRPEPTWINDDIIAAYYRFHEIGHAHSVETWLDGELAGGLYGVTVGSAYFGESMFHFKRDASKVALAHLWYWLKRSGFVLFDIQMITDVLQRFGARHVSKKDYLAMLKQATVKKRVLEYSEIDWQHEFATNNHK